jgi:hypothetical protein
MAQSYTTQDGITLINPGTYVSVAVQPGAGAIATAGVVTLVGEADQGPDWTQEADITQNMFAPSQYGAILAKYQSGRIVDAAKNLITAANDPSIVGAINLIRIIKVNPSQAASAILSRNGFGQYAKLAADIPGAPGNLINYTSAIAQAEIAPSTGAFAYCPSASPSSFILRVNGGVQKTITVASNEAPNVLQAAIEDYNLGILCLGGAQKLIIPAASLTLTATAPSSSVLIVSLPAASTFAAAPAIGDSAVIPSTSVLASGLASSNAASYIVTGLVNTIVSASITLARISAGNCVATSGSSQANTNPATADLIDYSDMTISNETGQDRQATVGLSGTFNVTSVSGPNAVIQVPAGTQWAAQPVPGDICNVQTNFGSGPLNAGFYQVISSTSTTVNITRVSVGSAGAAGSAVIGSPITPSTQPFLIEKPVIDGLGKSLAIEGSVASIFYVPSTQAPVTFSNSLLVSAAEYENAFTISQGQISDTFTSGGDVVLQIACSQQLATVQVTQTALNFSVNGVLQFSAAMAQYPVLSQLASFISSQSTFSAQVASATFNNQASSSLDEGTYGISGQAGVFAGRIKDDAISWMEAINQSALVSDSLIAFSGLPEAISPAQFLMNGSKAGSTSAQWTAAIDACQGITTNFIVALASQDASKDITIGATDPSSTYTIAGINAYLGAQVIFMSSVQMRQNRIALGSNLDTYINDKEAAGQVSSFRFGMAFQSVKCQNSQGVIATFQPWMAANIAAGMQAAAGYKGIVKKFANIQGIVNPVGFNSQNPGQTADALSAGLMCLESVSTGGFRWISDQLTYDADNNFVYNSLQAVYVSDLITLSLIDTFDRMVVGKSVADISAAAALSILDSEMFNFKRLKWIAASTDAPKGYRNANANLVGGALPISAEIKLAGLIYFVPINLLLTEVQQSASTATGA